jgi:pullulanase
MKYLLLLLGAFFMPQSASASDKLVVHYNRLNGDYAGWNLWTLDEGAKTPGFDLKQSGSDGFGAVYELDLAASGLAGKKAGLLPRKGNWEDKDAPDRFVSPAAPGVIYLLEGDPAVYSAPPQVSTKITGAYLDSSSEVRVTFTRPLDKDFVSGQGFYLTRGDSAFQPVSAEPIGGDYSRAALLSFDSLGNPDYQALDDGKYELHSRDFKPVTVALGDAVYGRAFSSAKEMGMSEAGGASVLRVFAPYAVKVEALVYDGAEGKPSVYALTRGDAGLWEKDFGRPLNGKYYRLRVRQGGRTYEGLDPYAACVTGDAGKALIAVDTTPVAPGPAFDPAETVLYEVHLRDLTSDQYSGVRNKGKYLGAAETGTRHPLYPEITTGLDHIAELGVNAVHILPFEDFENGDSTTAYN